MRSLKFLVPFFAAGLFLPLFAVNAGATTSNNSAAVKWAVGYVGGKAKGASSTLPPLTIGVTDQIGVGSEPQTGPTILAAQSYINKNLDGVDGHPVKLDVCKAQTAQDAQSCGESFANNPNVKYVVNSSLVFDDTAMLSALSSAGKATLLATAINPGEFTASDTSNYGPSSILLLPSLAEYTAHLVGGTNKSVSIVGEQVTSGQEAVAAMQGILSKANIANVKTVFVPAGATAPQYVSAIQASGAQDASVVIILATDQVCVDANAALSLLNAHPESILTTNGCLDSLVTKHFGGKIPASWRIFNFYNSSYVPGTNTGVNSYQAAMKQYAPTQDPNTTAAGVFATLLTSVKIANSVGYANITPASMITATRAFTGPAMMEPGPMKCGYLATYPSVCGSQVAIDRYTGKSYSESILTVKS